MRRILVASLFALAVAPASANAADTCGNTADDDSDDLTDEGCWPSGVPDVSVCESPLGCSAAAVAPLSGGLVHHVLPDLSPGVAFGPGLVFRRVYSSLYAPGYNFPSATSYKAPLGYRWMHSYMGWLERSGSGSNKKLVIHLPTGQDVMVLQNNSDSTYYYYNTFQPGWHFKEVKQLKTGAETVTVTTLTGERYEFNFSGSTGKLTKIQDSLATPNTVEIAYNGDGQVTTVTAADGKQLQFTYFSSGTKVLQYVKLFVASTERVALELKYETTGDDKRKLTEVWIAGTKVESYTYSSDYLTSVLDGAGKQVAAFRYLSSVAGKAVSVETPSGDQGFSYSASGCGQGESGTHLAYHRKDTTACDTTYDGADECGSGYFCAGETNPSADNTGFCFQARRLLCSTAPNEDLVEDVTASCSSCVDASHYDFYTNSPTNDKIELRGVQSADSVKTSFSYNSNGLVVTRVENDSDYDATTSPSGSRTTFFLYGNSSFPGRVTETRILSELKPGGTCTAQTTTDCKRTIYTYNSDGLLSSVQEKGFTLNSSETTVAYDFTTSYEYDSKGRLTAVRGARPSTDDDTEYTYWPSGNGLDTDHLKEVKRRKGSSSYLTTTHSEYEFWGAGTAKRIVDPNSRPVCRTFESKFGLLASSRVLVSSTAACSASPGSSDETTSYEYDTHRRLTKTIKPQLDCVTRAYDSEGRLSSVVEADYDGSSACYTTQVDTIEHTYSID